MRMIEKLCLALARSTAARQRGLKSLWATSGVSRTPHAAIARVGAHRVRPHQWVSEELT